MIEWKKRYWIYLLCLATAALVGYFIRPYRSLAPHQQIIERQAQAFALDANLIRAVIMTESGGDVKAVSRKGALGLMQLMPATATELATELEISLEKGDLFVPEINIRLGCCYLYRLMHRFNGRIAFVLAAFNTGPNRVERWAQELHFLSPEEVIARKANRETRNFVKQVLARYER